MKMKSREQNPSTLPEEENCLEFCGDNVDLNVWWSILNGMSQDETLPKIHISSRWYPKKVRERINSKEKLERFWHRSEKKLYPALYTNYLLLCLMDALSSNLKHSPMLRILVLDGIPLSNKYLETLCVGLSWNTNLNTLSLARCQIADSGCCLVLESLDNNLNLEKLNLSMCNLTGKSGYPLSLFLQRRKQILLKIELSRYPGRNGDSDSLPPQGLQTLILNNNPEFSDTGLRFLVDILKGDFWLKVLKLTSCGLNDKGEAILDLLTTNCVITTMDLRQNNIPTVISDVVQKLLKRRRREGGITSLNKILLTKKIIIDGEKKIKKKPVKVLKTNKSNLPKHRIPKKEKASTILEKKRFTSPSNIYKKPKPKPIIKTNQQKKKSNNVASKSISENQKANFNELKQRLSNIVLDNERLSKHLKLEREKLAKEKRSRLKIEKCCDRMKPEIADICRGILAHIDDDNL